MPPEQMPSSAVRSWREICSHGVHRLDDRRAVGVEVPRGVPRVGVAPGDDVDLQAAAHQVLDHGALLGEVDDVVLVDRRRDDQQRDLLHLRSLRGVLDELEDVRAQHDLARGHRQVLADLERIRLDHRGHARSRREVAHQPSPALHEVAAAGVERALEHLGVDERVVGRRQRLHEVLGDEAHPLRVAPVEIGVVDEPAHRLTAGQVSLEGAPVEGVLRPRLVGPATVLGRRRHLGATETDLRQLGSEARRTPRDAARVPDQAGGELEARHARDHPAQRARARVGEQELERRAELLARHGAVVVASGGATGHGGRGHASPSAVA